jgi:hypothetical protein
MSTPKFAYADLKLPTADGCYIHYERLILEDDDATPEDHLFHYDEYRTEDEKRLEAYYNDEWHYVGVRAVAHIRLVKNNVAFYTTLESAGVWGIESDSGEEYLREMFEQECRELEGWLKMIKVD